MKVIVGKEGGDFGVGVGWANVGVGVDVVVGSSARTMKFGKAIVNIDMTSPA